MIYRLILCLVLIPLSIFGIYRAVQLGVAGTIVRYAPETIFLQQAVESVPNDPELHRLLGLAYLLDPEVTDAKAALTELKRATELSPYSYQIWLVLANAQERFGDLTAAEESFKRAVSLAPNYQDPHWRLANFYLRNDKLAAAIPALKQALQTDNTQLDYAMDLVWQISDGDLLKVKEILPENDKTKAIYLQFLINKELYGDVLNQLSQEVIENEQAFTKTAQLLMERLISKGDYQQAYQAWKLTTEGRQIKTEPGRINNGDFATLPAKDGLAFNWQFHSENGAKLLLDHVSPSPNGNSLRIEYSANGSPNFDHIEQLVLAQPNKEYRFSYDAESEELVSGNVPVFEVIQHPGEQRLISQPNILGTTVWKKYELKFTTAPQTRAITIKLHRSGNCSTAGPCPIYGKVWFTNITLEPAK